MGSGYVLGDYSKAELQEFRRQYSLLCSQINSERPTMFHFYVPFHFPYVLLSGGRAERLLDARKTAGAAHADHEKRRRVEHTVAGRSYQGNMV